MKEEKDFVYSFFRIIYKSILKILYRPKIVGIENLPKTGSAILAGNHRRAFDPVLVMMCTKRKVHFLAKIEVSKGLHGKLFKRLGVIIVDRSKRNPAAVIASENILKSGGLIGIFPEGTRNRTEEELLSFKKGAVMMAGRTNSPIVPFAIKGKYKAFRGRVEIEFGKPIDVTNIDTKEANEKLRGEVLKLLRK